MLWSSSIKIKKRKKFYLRLPKIANIATNIPIITTAMITNVIVFMLLAAVVKTSEPLSMIPASIEPLAKLFPMLVLIFAEKAITIIITTTITIAKSKNSNGPTIAFCPLFVLIIPLACFNAFPKFIPKLKERVFLNLC